MTFMIEATDEEIAAANAEGERRIREDPHALSVRYDRKSGRIVLEMTTSCTLAIPARRIQGLADATDAELAEVELFDDGFALEWEKLDVHASIEVLARGVFGGKRWMAELARQGGVSRSPAKAAAARVNGAKGGRPRKTAAA